MRIVLFCRKGEINDVIYSHLKNNYNLVGVVLDAPIPKRIVFKRRLRRQGLLRVFLQTLFVLFIGPILKIEAKGRRRELLSELDIEAVDRFQCVFRPNSINEDSVLRL